METQQSQCLYIYKNNRKITSVDELPVPHSERIRTDNFCTIFTTIFALSIFIISVVSLDMENLQRMTYPTDQEGRHCTLDNPKFNYLYFASPKDPSKRMCLSECPIGNETRLKCWPTSNLSCSANSIPSFQVDIYPTEPTETSLGLFCQAKDPTLLDTILNNANLLEMYMFVSDFKSIGVAALAALVFSMISIMLFSYFPKFMSFFNVIVGGISCILAGLFLLLSSQNIFVIFRAIVIIFSVGLFILGLLLLWSSFSKKKEIVLSVAFIKQGIACFWESPKLALMSLVFIILLAGLTCLCGFQVLACWSNDEMVLNENSVYYRPQGTFSVVLTVIILVQFLWGLCFLKQAFNFLLSGTTVAWYFRGKHSFGFALGNLFKFHWGSIAGASFLLHLLYPIDLAYDIIKPDSPSPTIDTLCCCCQRVLDMVRTQTMAFVNIVGTPYCNSSRWCEKIEYHSSIFDGNQSASRYVRIGSHISLAFLSTLIAELYQKSQKSVSEIALVLSFVINLFIATFFVCLLADITQAVFFSTLVENYLTNQDQNPVEKGPIAKKLFGEGYEVLPTQY